MVMKMTRAVQSSIQAVSPESTFCSVAAQAGAASRNKPAPVREKNGFLILGGLFVLHLRAAEPGDDRRDGPVDF